MIFTKYRSMENSYRIAFMNKIAEEGFTSPKVLWVATEKIHGANGGLWTDGKEVRISKKSSFIKNSENFFKSDKVLKKYKDDVKMIFNTIKLRSDIVSKSICIWGELYGGTYSHPDVPRNNDSKQVQKGVFYNPNNDFLVFDIMIKDINNSSFYLSWNEVKRLVSMTELNTVPELATGTFEEMIQYPNGGLSKVYEMFNLPAIDNNIMEGVVLKPIKASFLKNGSRVIVKNKNKKWAEKANAPRRIRKSKKINEAIKPIVEEISLYITENRLRNVLSHIGEITQRDFGLLNKEFIADVMKDYLLENDNEKINVFDKKDKKIINKMIGKMTAIMIRENFLNIIDNTF